MLTVLIPSDSNVERLRATLTSLVPAAVDGFVTDVVITCANREPIAALCEELGAEIVAPSEIETKLDDVRGQWVLVLEEGAAVGPDWVAPVAAYVSTETTPARLRSTEKDRSFWRWLRGSPKRPLRAGYLVPKAMAKSQLRNASIEALPVGRRANVAEATVIPRD